LLSDGYDLTPQVNHFYPSGLHLSDLTALYQELFMRDNFVDNGTGPVTDSYAAASSDIIPSGDGTLT
jgi:hypothetical protein